MRTSLKTGILLSLFGAAAAIMVVELIPRLVPGLAPRNVLGMDRIYEARLIWESMVAKDPYLGYKMKPGLDLEFPSEHRKIRIRTVDYGLDGIGFRDLGTSPPFDVLVIGDSFAFCDGVSAESCWVSRFAVRSGIATGTLGVSGYSSLAEARMLKAYGAAFKPKIVLWSIFLNDFKDNVYFSRWLASGSDDYWGWMRARRYGGFSRTLRRYSILYRLIDGARRYRRKKVVQYKDGELEFVFYNKPWWLDLVRHPEQRHGWTLMQQAFRQMDETTRRMGATLVVLLFPFKEQVYWEKLRPLLSDVDGVDPNAPYELIRDYCAAQGVACCDLTEGFRQKAKGGQQLYLRVSGHWNDAGHALAADLVWRCLADKGLQRKPSRPEVAAGPVMTSPGENIIR